ncbi:hypothetical protein CBM2587_B90226 [Cupriavidus taiwanensis]|uniref:Uncharacterized protein n=1 Tax=Cupriavidus taiwanensis TaxID=164546 RepID=A0A375CCN5_9BURK|nr:hypothetical protein CBM2587_B90226 [Cupriavidus taiwanensis]
MDQYEVLHAKASAGCFITRVTRWCPPGFEPLRSDALSIKAGVMPAAAMGTGVLRGFSLLRVAGPRFGRCRKGAVRRRLKFSCAEES